MRKKLWMVGSFVAVIFTVFQAQSLTIQEAVSEAASTNAGLKSEQEQVHIQQEQRKQAWGSLLPSVDIEASWQKNDADNKDNQISKINNHNKTKSQALVLRQPLFRGGGTVASIRQAGHALDASVHGYESKKQNLVYQVISAYVDVLAKQESLLIADHQVSSLKRRVEGSQQQLNLGELTITDFKQTEAQLARAEADRADIQSNLLAAKESFFQLVGKEAKDLVEPAPLTFPALSLDQALERALRANPALRSSNASVEAAGAAVWVARSSLLPQADLQLSAGRSYVDQKTGDPWEKNSTTASRRSLEKSASLSLRIPLFAGGRRWSQAEASEYQRRSAVFQRDNQRNQLVAQLRSTWQQVLSTKISREAYAVAADAAKTALEGIQESYRQGTETMLNVLDMERQWYQARFSYISSRYQHILATYNLLYTMGQLEAELPLPGQAVTPDASAMAETPALAENATMASPVKKMRKGRRKAITIPSQPETKTKDADAPTA